MSKSNLNRFFRRWFGGQTETGAKRTVDRRTLSAGGHFRLLESLEGRQMLSVSIQFDYSLDSAGFFNQQIRRDVLELAATTLTNRLTDSLTAITPGGADGYSMDIFDPSTLGSLSLPNVSVGADTLIIYAGSQSFNDGTLGVGGPAGVSNVSGSTSFINSVLGRGQAGALLPTATDFGTPGGAITFDRDTPWYFGTGTGGLSSGFYDFYSVAVHELGHVLGIGTADSWLNLVSGTTFNGTASAIANGGVKPSVMSDGGHWALGTTSDGQEASMTPSIGDGVRKYFTTLDFAGLDDLGWSLSVGVDNTLPMVTVNQSGSQTDPTGTSPVSFTVVFSEPVSGFTASDISFTGSTVAGTLSASLLPQGDGFTYTLLVTGMTGSGTVVASIPAGSVTDASGNPNTASTSTDNSVTFDANAFLVTIDRGASQADPSNGSVVFDVVFNHPTTNFATGDVAFTGSTAPGTLVGTVVDLGDGMHYTVTVTGMTGSGAIVASIPAGVATDSSARSNNASTSTDNSIVYDITAPTVTVNQAASQLDPTHDEYVYFTVVFSEPVFDFTATDLSLAGTTAAANLGDLEVTISGASDGLTYTVAIRGMNQTGLVMLSLPSGVAYDAAGNFNLASTSADNQIEYDITRPTVTIDQSNTQSDPTNRPNEGSGASVGPEFDDGLTIDNDISDPTAAGYFSVIVGDAGTVNEEGDYESGVVSAVGRTQVAAAEEWIYTFMQYVDVGADGGAYSLTTSTITTHAHLIAPDTVSSSGYFPGANGLIYWTVVSNFANGSSTFTNQFSFASAQPFGAVRFISYFDGDVFDNSVNVVSTDGTPGQAGFTAFILGQNQGVGIGQTGLYPGAPGSDNASNVTFDGWAADYYNTLQGAITGAGATFSVDGNINTGYLPASTDAYGRVNYGPGDIATAFAWSLNPDATSATLTTGLKLQSQDISYDPGNEAIHFNVTFSEPVVNFYPSAISFAGSTAPGTLVAHITPAGDGMNFVVSVTGMTGDGTVVVSLPEGAATDAALNSSYASTSFDNSVVFDITKPSAAITTTAPDYLNTGVFTVNVEFSEPVAGFSLGDLRLDNATAGNLTGSGSSYTFEVYPVAQGRFGVYVPTGSVYDSALNGNTASNSLYRTFDTIAPTVTLNQASTQVDAAYIGPVVFTAVFSEPVVGFTSDDLVLGGTADRSNATYSLIANGNVFTITVSGISSAGTVTLAIPDGGYADRAGNVGSASTSNDNTVTLISPQPTIDTLEASTDRVTVGKTFTLSLTSETGNPLTNGKYPVQVVNFYRDANGDGILQPDRDELVGSDTNGNNGWSVNVNTTGFPVGETRFFARADDHQGNLSNTLSTDIDLFRTNASDRTGKASYYDANGKLVTVAITGGGTFSIDFLTSEPNANPEDITVFGSTAKTNLTITTRGNALTNVANIVVGNINSDIDRTNIRNIAARTTNLTHGLQITGAPASLAFNNLTNATLTIGPAPSPSLAFNFTAAQILNSSINSKTAIQNFTAINWLDGEGCGKDTLVAPWIANFSITGAKNIAGDIEADVTLNSSAVRYNVTNLNIAGQMRNASVAARNGIYNARIGSMANSALSSGLKSSARGGLPDSVDAFLQTDYSLIRYVFITSDAPNAFAGSNIVAYKLGNVRLTTVNIENDETPFGLASNQTASYKGPLAAGDFVLRTLVNT